MAKFCTRCGSRLDEETGLCPNCDAKAIQKIQYAKFGGKRAYKRAEKRKRKAEKKAAAQARRAAMGVGQKIGRAVRFFFLIVLFLLLLSALVAAGLVYWNVLDIPLVAGVMETLGIETKHYDESVEFHTLSESFTDVLITDESTAILAAQDAAKSLGLGNAADDLTVSDIARFDETVYYRMQQNYNGIPVYGRTVTVVADAEGKAVGFSGNAVPISRVSFERAASQESIESEVREYFSGAFVCSC